MYYLTRISRSIVFGREKSNQSHHNPLPIPPQIDSHLLCYDSPHWRNAQQRAVEAAWAWPVEAGSDRQSAARDKLNPMKCGAKYTWVGRDKRKTAASFPDTTRDAQMVAILKCVIIPIVMDTCTFLSLSWCCSTQSLARYKMWGVTLDSLESSQQ